MLLYTIRPYIRPKIWLISDYDSAVLSPKIMIRLFIKGTWHQIWPIWHRRKTKKQQSGNNTNTISIQCHWYSVRIISTLLFYIKKGHHPVISKDPFHCYLHWLQLLFTLTTLSMNIIFNVFMYRRLRWPMTMTENCLPHSVQITYLMFSCIDVWDDPWLKTVYHTQYR